jgi:peptide deformylase
VIETLRAAGAVGLTASHIGDLRRLIVIRLDPADEPHVRQSRGGLGLDRTGRAHGRQRLDAGRDRADRAPGCVVRVRYQDLSGTVCEEEAKGFRAACLQHEMDQLDGVFWIDRLSRLKRDRLVKRFDKLRRANAT